MPLNSLKKWLFNKELKKEINVLEDNGVAVGIYTLYNNDQSQIEEIYNFIATQGTKRENIHILAFANQKEAIVNATYPVYTQKEIKWAGFPQHENVTKFISRKYKRFYYLCPSFDAHQRYILSKIKADFKAGIYAPSIETMLDFTLDNQFSSPLESLKEIYTTISKLRSK
jgi:hypothetical protein